MRRSWLGMLFFACALSACGPSVGVHRVAPRTVQQELETNAVVAGRPSAASRGVLRSLGLEERFQRDPEETLAELHAGAVNEMSADRLFALAEYSFLHADRTSRREYFLAASVYAYAFLFPEDGSPSPSGFDPRLRTASQIYNRSLSRSLVSAEGEIVGGVLPPHVGSLRLTLDRSQLDWADRRLARFVSADELQVRGMRNRHRRGGLGAPFVAETAAIPDVTLDARSARVIDGARVPVTFVVRYVSAREGLRRGELRGAIEIHSEEVSPEIEVAGRRVPLEFETSTALASGLEASQLWRVSRAGFLRGDFISGFFPDSDGLFMLSPHRSGRVPVVLVHGTASSPARWAEMLNDLQADPVLAEHFEFWLFLYSTGNPILYSASLLRQALQDAVAELDPGGTDAALKRMVLVGHSQGGLIVKLQTIASGDRFWRLIRDESFEDASLEPESRELLERALFFEPVPFVRDAVFLATPHGGSFVADSWVGRFASRMSTAPDHLGDLPREFARASLDAGREAVDRMVGGVESVLEIDAVNARLTRLPTSIENMAPGRPFLEALSEAPVDPAVRTHSIISVLGDPPHEGQDDGVVTFEAARLEGATSEYVVPRSGHSVQLDPRAIERVRQILLWSLPTNDPAETAPGS